jgi:nicotinate-nucleotide adenylyltransferase
MTTRRLGILGGTFDPIHCGHLDLGEAAESALGLSGVAVIASNIPPHRPQPLASSYHRFAMVALAIAGRDRWQASDLELAVGAPSFTTGTLQRFHDRGYAAIELFFIIGADAFAEIETWKDFPAILDRAHFAVVSRPGLPVDTLPTRLPALARRMAKAADAGSRTSPSIFLIDARTADVSATAIRRRAAVGESIAGLVPAAVGQHIAQHALYSSPLAEADIDRTSAAGRLHGQN